jgi:hypothetical protein
MAPPRHPSGKQFVSPPHFAPKSVKPKPVGGKPPRGHGRAAPSYIRARSQPSGPRPITVKDNGRPATQEQLDAHARAQRAKYQGQPPPTAPPQSRADYWRERIGPSPAYVRQPHTIEEHPTGATISDRRAGGSEIAPLRTFPSQPAPNPTPWYMWGTREGARTSGDTPNLAQEPLSALPWYDWGAAGF